MRFWKRLSRAFTGPPSPGWRPPIRAVWLGVALVAAFLFEPSSARATLYFQDDPTTQNPKPDNAPLGHFAGSLTFTSTGTNSGTLVLTLKNTSAAGAGYYLTEFDFGNPADKITHVSSFTGKNGDGTTNSKFELVGGPSFQDGINIPPFGKADIGARVKGDDLTDGIAAGSKVTFTFDLTGTGVGKLTEKDFTTELTDA
jgi:hypothetical protein